MRSSAACGALILLLGCTPSGGAPRGAAPALPRAQAGEPYALARRVGEAVALELPPSSREGPTPAEVAVRGPFRLLRTVKGVQVYEAPLPARPRSLFFTKPPEGMAVVGPEGKELPFARRGVDNKAWTWAFTEDTLLLRVPADHPAPEAGLVQLRWGRAQERERSLNLEESGLAPAAFAARSLQLGPDTRTGLLLPAPARAAWELQLPPSATLQLDGVILPPEYDDGVPSDGAALVVRVTDATGEAVEVLRQPLQVGSWSPLHLDLSRWEGQAVRLELATEPGEGSARDYVFLAEPTVYTPVEDPKRVLLVFLDTLRADHLGTYGYERPTSPRLDAWAETAVVFEQARSVAPWTLPSTRTVLSGRQPELWREGDTLPERLAALGWATGAFVGNIYLSSNFDMAQGWSQHGCVNWPLAEVQVDRVQDFLQRHPDRDALVMLHTMDAHLPYTEPMAYRSLWAGPAPVGLEPDDTRTPILTAARKDREAVRQYVIDRYDQNIRYLDDQVSALLEALGPQTTVVLFADHGEEFWDHGDFEHGHTLYDELLRVPFIVYDPSLPPGRVSAPVSLLDLTPTLLELLGLPGGGVQGLSLVGAARQDPAALQALSARDQGFGRPLYGDERWGVLADGVKWTTHQGQEAVYDLRADPAERQDQVRAGSTRPEQLAALRAQLGAALGTELPLSWRLDFGQASKTPTGPSTLELRVPGGFRAAWLGGDPLKGADMRLEGPDADGVVRVHFGPGKKGARELYLVPTGEPTALEGLLLTWDGAPVTLSAPSAAPPEGRGGTLASGRAGGRAVTVTWGLAPLPGAGREVEGMDSELEKALEALGYHSREGEPDGGGD